MTETKSDIIAQLRRNILPLKTSKGVLNPNNLDKKLGALRKAFPNESFTLGAIHEFIAEKTEDVIATTGFIAVIMASLMKNNGAIIWIRPSQTIFPPALQSFDIAPDKIIFIHLQKEKEMLWAMEEALRCDGLAAVITEVKELSFTASRRLQLAVEKSNVTGFVLRQNPYIQNTTACVTRWKITSLPTGVSGIPGVGFPRWNVELLKVRNGKPGTWQIEFAGGHFRYIYKIVSIPQQQQKKTG